MPKQIILIGLTQEQLRAEMAKIIREEVSNVICQKTQEMSKTETENSMAIPKRQLSIQCGVSYNTLQKWLLEDNIDHAAYRELDEFSSKHCKYSRKTNSS
jgi:hypothetical protein